MEDTFFRSAVWPWLGPTEQALHGLDTIPLFSDVNSVSFGPAVFSRPSRSPSRPPSAGVASHLTPGATSGVLGRLGLSLGELCRAHLQRGWSEGVHQHQGAGPRLLARRPVGWPSPRSGRRWFASLPVPTWRGRSRPGTPHQGAQLPRFDGRVRSRALGRPCLRDWRPMVGGGPRPLATPRPPERRNHRRSAQWRHALGSDVGAALSCCAAQAFAMSLLERRGGLGADGEVPTTSDVVWSDRFPS